MHFPSVLVIGVFYSFCKPGDGEFTRIYFILSQTAIKYSFKKDHQEYNNDADCVSCFGLKSES